MTTDGRTRHAVQAECESFLYRAAELLDNRELSEWHDLLTEDITYRVPVRTTRERSNESEFSDEAFHMKEDWETLKIRTERMQNDFAWSEDPPSRTRRHVSTVRVADETEDSIDVKSHLLLFRARRDDTEPDLLSMERRDVLRRTENGLKLADRVVYLDHTVIPTDSLSIIL
jgi:3-phenylpropionate/cinnamic acid dioxygenase small subunit